MMITKINKPSLNQTIKINKNIIISSTGAVKFLNTVFLPSSVLIQSGKITIYIDPFFIDDPKPADYIFITHDHPDHFSIKSIKKILKKETTIICPKTVHKKLKEYNVMRVNPGDKILFNNLKCEAVASYNLKRGFLWKIAHPKKLGYTGFIIEIEGIRIYHSGDTDLIPEMKKLKNIYAALIPINGCNLAMTIEDAASFVTMVKPKMTIPIHYETGKNKVEKLKKFSGKNAEIKMLWKE